MYGKKAVGRRNGVKQIGEVILQTLSRFLLENDPIV